MSEHAEEDRLTMYVLRQEGMSRVGLARRVVRLEGQLAAAQADVARLTAELADARAAIREAALIISDGDSHSAAGPSDVCSHCAWLALAAVSQALKKRET